MKNAAEFLSALQSGTEIPVRSIPDTDEGNAILEALLDNQGVRQVSRKIKGAHVVVLTWGR